MNLHPIGKAPARALGWSPNLLVSTAPTMIMEVSRAHDAFDDSRLEVTGLIDKACAVLGRSNVALLMIHLTPQIDRDELARLLRFRSPNRPTATTYLCQDPHLLSPELRKLAAESRAE